jgi:hypothetical protein
MNSRSTEIHTARVLIGMETSGAVRDRLRAMGIDAWSCDLLPSDAPSRYHIQSDVFDVADQAWTCALFHPTCTYLTCAAEWAYADGPYHQKVKPETLVGAARRKARQDSLNDVRRLMALRYPKIIENPKGAISRAIRKPDQVVQPWMFGDDASKETHIWLDRVPALKWLPEEEWATPRLVPGKRGVLMRWSNQTDAGQNRLTPGRDRWKDRSKTYDGIADAFADALASVCAALQERKGIAA